jgi:hypothetical protein
MRCLKPSDSLRGEIHKRASYTIIEFLVIIHRRDFYLKHNVSET